VGCCHEHANDHDGSHFVILRVIANTNATTLIPVHQPVLQMKSIFLFALAGAAGGVSALGLAAPSVSDSQLD